MASTADCKAFIIQWVQANKGLFHAAWEPDFHAQIPFAAMTSAKSWKRRSKYKQQGKTFRRFSLVDPDEDTFIETCVIEEKPDGSLEMAAFLTAELSADLVGRPDQIQFFHASNSDGQWIEMASKPMLDMGIPDQHLPASPLKTQIEGAGFCEASESFWLYYGPNSTDEAADYSPGVAYLRSLGLIEQPIFDH